MGLFFLAPFSFFPVWNRLLFISLPRVVLVSDVLRLVAGLADGVAWCG
jgi:hypothetical protein